MAKREPTLTVTRSQLQHVFRHWVLAARTGHTTGPLDTAMRSVEDVAENQAETMWRALRHLNG
jgi:hypothetical protein